MDVDKLESLISKAEIEYKRGDAAAAIRCAKKAVTCCGCRAKVIALRIFIARCYSKLGKFEESNKIYRNLLKERVYIAPVVFGIFYNNFSCTEAKKMKLNLVLVKSCLLLP